MPSALRIKEIRDLEDNVMMSNGALTENVSLESASFPAGHIIQTVTEYKTDTETISGYSGYVDIDFQCQITPKFSNSKILVSVNIEAAGGGSNYTLSFKLLRDSTEIGLADALSSRPRTFGVIGAQPWSNYVRSYMSKQFLDTPPIPSTPIPITYKMQARDNRDGGYILINRQWYDYDGGSHSTGTSSIVLQEISQ